jgi:hypothetical protein
VGLELRARSALELKIPRSFQNVKGYPRRKFEKKKERRKRSKKLLVFLLLFTVLDIFSF